MARLVPKLLSAILFLITHNLAELSHICQHFFDLQKFSVNNILLRDEEPLICTMACKNTGLPYCNNSSKLKHHIDLDFQTDKHQNGLDKLPTNTISK